MVAPIRYFVVKCNGQWRVEYKNRHWNGFASQNEAIESAIKAAREKADTGKSVEVLVQGEDRTWHTQWASSDLYFKVK